MFVWSFENWVRSADQRNGSETTELYQKERFMARKFTMTQGSAWVIASLATFSFFGIGYVFVFLGASSWQKLQKEASEALVVEEDIEVTTAKAPKKTKKTVSGLEEVLPEIEGEDPFDKTNEEIEEAYMEKKQAELEKKVDKEGKVKVTKSMDKLDYWSYAGEYGPTNWANISPDFKACGGSMQSPVALESHKAQKGLESLKLKYNVADLVFENLDNKLLKAKALGAGSLVFRGHTYNSYDVIFHAPSEHFINSMRADMEIHIRHRDPRGNQANLAIRVEIGDRNFKPGEPIFQFLPEKGKKSPSIKTELAAFLPKRKGYFYYQGSETFPPCEEGVKWFVLHESIYMSARQLDQFMTRFQRNMRPPQPLNGRKVRIGGSLTGVSH